jgi:DNA polymerase I-like protein with 3'-5' exonuclease and polymerase domains
MVALYKAGLPPVLQVHDEIVLSVNTREEAEEGARIMEQAARLEVPTRCDVEIGTSWGASMK